MDNKFVKDKNNITERFTVLFDELNKNVIKYIDKDKPILKGEIEKYNNFLDGKHISEEGKEPLKVLNDFSKLFQRAVQWEQPGTMINITPPANLPSIVASAYVSLYNPNFAQDESSGYLMTTELLVSKYLSELVGWNDTESSGIFTFGGKGTNMYAVKIGLNKVIPNIKKNGINQNKIVIFSSEKGHPCHQEICDWLGLGTDSCKRLKTTATGQIDLHELENKLRENIEQDIKIGCIILNGGTTNEIIIDPIKDVVDLRDRLVKEYNLNYIPHIHIDAVIGWAWLFFKNYNFEKNNLNMNKIELKKIKSMKNKITQLYYADSFGADFHKTGFCPYVSSIFMAKKTSDIIILGNNPSKCINNMTFGEYSPFEYSLELTRAATGPVSAYVALETFGISGYQKLIYNLFSNSEYIRNKLNANNEFEVLNNDTEGIATLFMVKNKNYKEKKLNIINESDINKIIEYNNQFYLYCLNKLEKNEIHFKITYSKSYIPYNCKIKTGALKIYPTSPLTTKEELDEIIKEMIDVKKEFDMFEHKVLFEKRNTPVDFVYR